MKTLFSLCLCLVLLSCSSDKDPVTVADPIIGIWQPDYSEVVFIDGTKNVEAISPCELNNRFTFEADGTFFRTSFPEGNDPDCEELVGDPFQSGTWTKMTDTRYLIELYCSIPNCNDKEEEYPDEIVFPDLNTMRVRINDAQAKGVPVDYLYLYYQRTE